MPRVNWSLSPEAKAVFDAYQRERGFKNQDEAINAMMLEFDKMPWCRHKETSL